jgi:hypothetical protein
MAESYLVQRPGTGVLTPEASQHGWTMLASGQVVPPKPGGVGGVGTSNSPIGNLMAKYPGMDNKTAMGVLQGQQWALTSARNKFGYGGAPGTPGAPAGGGGANPGQLANVAKFMQQQQQQNLADNQARLDKIMGLAGQFGQTALQQNADQTRRAGGQVTSSLVGRGLGNTTVLDTMQQGVQRQGQQQANAIGEQVAGMQAGILERVQQPGPDLGLYANLLMQPGALNGKNNVLTALTGGGGAAQKPAGPALPTAGVPGAPGGFRFGGKGKGK